MTKPIIDFLYKLSINTPAKTSYLQKDNVVLKYVSEKWGEEVWSGLIWLNV